MGKLFLLVKLSDLLALQEMFPASIAILVWSRCNCAGLLENMCYSEKRNLVLDLFFRRIEENPCPKP